jgi:integrase
MTLLAYEGALRRETLVGLEIGDIDLPNHLIKIRPEIVKGGQGNVVVFSAPTANAYARYLPELKGHRQPKPAQEQPPVPFCIRSKLRRRAQSLVLEQDRRLASGTG